MQLGQKLVQLCQKGQQEIILVAPFIKAQVIEYLINNIKDSVCVKCITRWRPNEIIVGVSDLEVWPLLKQCPKASLWLRTDLHAKYYRIDNDCLIGSANLTASALGWSQSPNLELLVSLSANTPQLKNFETEIFLGAVQVDDNLFEYVSRLVDILKNEESISLSKTQELINSNKDSLIVSTNTWVPTLRHPEKLYTAYVGKLNKLSQVAKISATSDLHVLLVPPGLTKSAFKVYIGTILLQKPIINRVDKFVTTPQRFGAVRDLLDTLPCSKNPNFDSSYVWQTLMRWLLHFLPSRYELSVPHHSEIFCRVKKSTKNKPNILHPH